MNLSHVVTQRILNVFVKETILLTLNRSRTIIKCFVLGVLFTCVLIGLSSAPIFAASEDSPSSEVSSWLAPDLDSVKAKELAEEVYPKLSEGTRAAYDVNDVYLLLNNYFKGSLYNSSESTTSIFPLVRISGYLHDIYSAIFGNASGNNYFDGMHEMLTYQVGSQFYSQAELQAMTWGKAGDILTAAQAIAQSNSQINTTLQNLNSKIPGNFSWITSSISPQWYLNSSRSVISTSQSGSAFTAVFRNFYSTYQDIPLLFRVYVPFMASDLYNVGSDFILSVGYFDPSNNNITPVTSEIEYYLEPAVRGTYIYLFGFRPHNVSYVTFTLSGALQYDSSYSGSVSYCSFDTDQYQQIKQAFNSYSLNHSISSLADYFVSPEKQAAENASQAVIDDTLDGFTGNGSAAAKTSDTGSMKNMSGSLQSGLNSGASASHAASVFSNQTFWSWFTQATSNGINNPYPAPVVQNTRGSGDYVPDFLSGNQAELNDLLNQRDSW